MDQSAALVLLLDALVPTARPHSLLSSNAASRALDTGYPEVFHGLTCHFVNAFEIA